MSGISIYEVYSKVSREVYCKVWCEVYCKVSREVSREVTRQNSRGRFSNTIWVLESLKIFCV